MVAQSINSAGDTNGRPFGASIWATVLIAAAALLVYVWPAASAALVYDRARILSGEWWRIATGHWVHFSPSHLGWNLAVIVAAGIWCERVAPMRTRWLYVIAPVFIGGLLFAADANLRRYAGLSGIATSVLVLLALTQWRAGRDRWFWAAVLGLVVVKTAIEARQPTPLFSRFIDAESQTVPLAHLAGAMIAVVVHGFRRPLRK